MERNIALSKWLEHQYIEWMRTKGKISSQREFAEYLDIDPMNLNNYLNAKRKMPDSNSIKKIAAKLGPEIYDVLGLARPDADLKQVTAVWHKLSEETKKRILEIAKTNQL